jgi:hypothetical protein
VDVKRLEEIALRWAGGAWGGPGQDYGPNRFDGEGTAVERPEPEAVDGPVEKVSNTDRA